ncbi:hypothetical protein GLYMA_13G097650v4 [Glycine max]|nr:hypothetical protein GLYMA_13G097650v4 [Glycine max]KAH1100651.1 hypothetical protein GYH30_035682 [Glycine max]
MKHNLCWNLLWLLQCSMLDFHIRGTQPQHAKDWYKQF